MVESRSSSAVKSLTLFTPGFVADVIAPSLVGIGRARHGRVETAIALFVGTSEKSPVREQRIRGVPLKSGQHAIACKLPNSGESACRPGIADVVRRRAIAATLPAHSARQQVFDAASLGGPADKFDLDQPA